MNPKQKLSGAIVFASVFLGSFLGAGITLLTNPKSGRDLAYKVKDAADLIKENIGDQVDNTTIRVIENSTRILAKSKMGMEKAATKFNSLKGSLSSLTHVFDKKKEFNLLGSN